MTKTARGEERTRFCDHCNALIGWFAAFCDECGLEVPVAEEGGTPAPAREEARYAEVVQAHLRLLTRSRERTDALSRSVGRLQKGLARELSEGTGTDRRSRLVALSERLLELEDEWNEVQHAYNRQSESVEEEFLAKNEEMALDVDLPVELRETLDQEVRGFVSLLEAVQVDLSAVGAELDRALWRERSNLFGLPTGGTGPLLVLIGISLVVLVGGAAALWLTGTVSLATAALGAAPGAIVLALWAVFARSRH